MAPEAIDHEARELARSAKADVSAHERVCSERMLRIEKGFDAGSKRMTELATGLREIKTILIGGGIATIGALGGALWWSAVQLTKIAVAGGLEKFQ
jgi:hypothetical protein